MDRKYLKAGDVATDGLGKPHTWDGTHFTDIVDDGDLRIDGNVILYAWDPPEGALERGKPFYTQSTGGK